MTGHAKTSTDHHATRSIYGAVLLTTMMPVLEISLMAFTTSWNTIYIELYGGKVEALMVLTAVFQLSFAVVACCVWNASTPLPDWH
jgi:hypothetical protein